MFACARCMDMCSSLQSSWKLLKQSMEAIAKQQNLTRYKHFGGCLTTILMVSKLLQKCMLLPRSGC